MLSRLIPASTILGILLASIPTAVGSAEHVARAEGPADQYIAKENPIALQGILDNIGPKGIKAPGAKAGIVVASPSTFNPNCE